MQFESRNTKMIASHYMFANNDVDESTFILLRENYVEICSMILAKTDTMHA
jgi:hypothetical protein